MVNFTVAKEYKFKFRLTMHRSFIKLCKEIFSVPFPPGTWGCNWCSLSHLLPADWGCVWVEITFYGVTAHPERELCISTARCLCSICPFSLTSWWLINALWQFPWHKEPQTGKSRHTFSFSASMELQMPQTKIPIRKWVWSFQKGNHCREHHDDNSCIASPVTQNSVGISQGWLGRVQNSRNILQATGQVSCK